MDNDNKYDQSFKRSELGEDEHRHERVFTTANLSNDNLPPYASLDRFNEKYGL